MFSKAFPTRLCSELGPDGHHRHVLAGKPLQRGQFVEVLMPRGVWVRAVYEWEQPYSDDHYDISNPPVFIFGLGGPWEEDSKNPMPTFRTYLPDDAVLRHLRVARPPRANSRRPRPQR